LGGRMEMTWEVAEVREYAPVSTIGADRGLGGSCRCFLLSCRGLIGVVQGCCRRGGSSCEDWLIGLLVVLVLIVQLDS
jgi:hypothetical protein